jgi:hypothetical protein
MTKKRHKNRGVIVTDLPLTAKGDLPDGRPLRLKQIITVNGLATGVWWRRSYEIKNWAELAPKKKQRTP